MPQPQTLHERSVLVQPTGDAQPGDGFGTTMAVSSDRLVVGAPGDDERGTDAGAAYIYRRVNGRWQFEAKLAPEMLRGGDGFGRAVAIDLDCIAVGAPGDDRDLNDAGLQVGTVLDRGAAYVFRLRKGRWQQEARLQPQALPGDDPNILIGAGDAFGSAVAARSRRVIVGAPLSDHVNTPWGAATDAGAAYVFDLGLSWYLSKRLWVASGTYSFVKNGRFGASAIFDVPGSDNNILIGMPYVGELSPGTAFRYTNFVNNVGTSDWQSTFVYSSSRFQLSGGGASEGVGFNTWADGRLVVSAQGLRLESDVNLRALTPAGRVTQIAANNFVGYYMEHRAVWVNDQLAFRYSQTQISTVAPDGGDVFLAGSNVSGLVDGTGGQARFYSIGSAIPDGSGGLYVADGPTIRHVDAAGTVVTLCGSSDGAAPVDGVGTAARLRAPAELRWNAADNSLYFLDGYALRVMRPGHVVETLAGQVNEGGSLDGHGTSARLFAKAFTFDPAGGFMIAETWGLRRVSEALDVTTVIRSDAPNERIVDGGSGVARFLNITSLIYYDGLLYFIDGSTARTLSPGGLVTTIAGLPMPDVFAPTEFGAALASDGTTLLVGAPRMSPPTTPSAETSGIVWAFRTTQQGNPYRGLRYPLFPASGRDATMQFGTSVALADERAFVGSVHAGGAGPSIPVMAFERDADNVWTQALLFATSGVAMGSAFGASLAVVDADVLVGSPSSDGSPAGFVAVFSLADRDTDGDGMSDGWETQFGLDPASAAGVNGAAGDKDADGVSNVDEFQAQTHPAADPTFTRYFAEGATTWQFGTWIFLANPGSDTATAQLRFLRGDGTVRSHVIAVPGMTMQYVAVQDLPEMLDVEFATTIESDRLIVADRAMWWPRAPEGNAYGSHAERAVSSPARTWYLAEGATHSGFDLFYLLQNPNPFSIPVEVEYLRPALPFPATSPGPLRKIYDLPALSRTTIWVNHETFDIGNGPEKLLASTDVAAVFRGLSVPPPPGVFSWTPPPYIVERALYRGGPNGRQFEAGHESAGVTAPSTSWFFAEGATGDMFDTFFLVANPDAGNLRVRATYLLDDGRTFSRDLTVGSYARANIWADVESFDGGITFPLANAAFSTTLTALDGRPFIAERSMWWPGPSHTTWHEAHNSFGATETGTKWVAAFGHVPIMLSSATYLLIANPGDEPATVQVTRLNASGPSPAVTYTVAPHSRFNVAYDGPVPAANGFFGAIVESVGSPATPIVVERATYSTEFGGTQWSAGTAALLTKIQ